jgi:hypothetical protein
VRGLTGKLLLVALPGLLLGLDQLRRRRQVDVQPLPVDNAFRVAALIAAGRRALAAGHAELAARAAEGALELDGHNRAAWLLKLAATKAQEHVSA